MMLEQEKKNLEKLREHESQNGSEIAKAEANIRTLQDQLRASTNDVSFTCSVVDGDGKGCGGLHDEDHGVIIPATASPGDGTF